MHINVISLPCCFTMAVTGLPIYAGSLYALLTSLVLVPIILNRNRLEEKMLTEEFQETNQKYKETTKKLNPFISSIFEKVVE